MDEVKSLLVERWNRRVNIAPLLLDETADLLRNEVYAGDDYGVEGSTFWRCEYCDQESGAGMLNNGITHEPDCIFYRIEKALNRKLP
jgi:hypothetical protein